MEYCFHHIPKTAGSSLQLRLAHREHVGQLPKGSTLVVYPLYDGMRFYRVSEDPNFDFTKPIKQAFLRTYKTGNPVGKSTIVCGHYTNISQPGTHITWLRDPLARDVSHFNYDCKYGNELTKDFAQHLSMMSGNFVVLWLYGKYIGRHDSVDMKSRYKTVRKVLKEKFLRVYDSDNFEASWDEVADMLKIDKEPRLSSNRSHKDYEQVQKLNDLSEDFKVWHRSYNNYDYLLYEEFCK
tara:strand:- start:15 stop:728 length:714 start_codon:yes stop_codon:yes gene_type:complete